ncbi:MAG: P-loop NTPase fold protein [Parvibaculum sp.]|uniref:KAP family P-loop NTPase fold protein n=1 Tax=Parvibaculum sp. TaxID=2024848 RepID=UPI002730D905|nr:P-loop NTPase fold protein [Parvibaculum sp.]MDP2151621.1 P-loop NTPase fold protein [Parvibaculum sp.]
MKQHGHIRLHPEQPIVIPDAGDIFGKDLLGFKDSVIRLSELINNIQTPFTLGIFGTWGSGKTSFMKLLQAYTERELRFRTFWFEAWQYENEASLLMPLLSKMSKELKAKKIVKNKVLKSAAVVTMTGFGAILNLITNNAIPIGDVEKNFERYEKFMGKRYESWVGEIDELKVEFKALVADVSPYKPLIIFIDDLDRCMPENVVKLIENIKHFLSVDGCIFVLGVDKEVLSKGIQARYGSNLIDGDDYLEKIINLNVSLPYKHEKFSEDFIDDTFKRFAAPEFYKEIAEKTTPFKEVISAIKTDNPRKLRKLILRYLFFLSLPEHDKYVQQIVAVLIVYREFFKDAYLMKKDRGNILFFPSEAFTTESISYSEIEEKSCRGFAEIATQRKYDLLKNYGTLQPFISGCFNKPLSKAIDFVKGELIGNPLKDEYLKMLKNGVKNTHADYFELIEFLFSLK